MTPIMVLQWELKNKFFFFKLYLDKLLKLSGAVESNMYVPFPEGQCHIVENKLTIETTQSIALMI